MKKRLLRDRKLRELPQQRQEPRPLKRSLRLKRQRSERSQTMQVILSLQKRTAGDEADHTQDGGEGAPGLRGQGGASVVARGVCADGSADDHGQHGKGCAGCAVR